MGQQKRVRAMGHSAEQLREALNRYAPYVGAGIHVTHIAPDFGSATVQLELNEHNQNYFGTQFGGSMSSMTNPFYVLMLASILGSEYVIWDVVQKIHYHTPGRGTVYAHFKLTEDQIAEIRTRTADGQKFEPVYNIDIVDDAGTVIATVEQTLYLRKAPAGSGGGGSRHS
jgi:acyl-coenzyme A thioesterase PaaI-like protein